MSETAGAAVHGMPAAFDAILALGTNIGDREANIEEAIRIRTGESGLDAI